MTLFTGNHEMNASVALPAVFRVLLTERQLFAVTDRREAVGADAEGSQVLLGCACALGTQGQIVLHCATFVAVPFDFGLRVWMIFQPVPVLAQRCARRLIQLVGIKWKVNVPQGALF